MPSAGVDLCCWNGAGLRFLVWFRNVGHMTGVDATARIVERGRRRTEEEGLSDRIDFVLGDASDAGLLDAAADFVWGEDAWCYVEDKRILIAEAAERFLRFMRFPNALDLDDYRGLLEEHGCQV